jgi:hypothetical protein
LLVCVKVFAHLGVFTKRWHMRRICGRKMQNGRPRCSSSTMH